MKKRFAVFFIAVLSCLCFAFGFAGCEVLGKVEHEHRYGEWAQSLAPTCTAVGKETRSCIACEEKEERDISVLGHNYVADTENSKAPTCTAAGVNVEKCTRCEDVKTSAGAAIDPNAHSYVADEENSKAPTCVAAGVNAEKCELCGDAKTSVGEPATNNHSYVADEENTKAPTCGAAGVNAEKCTVCGDAKTSVGEPATNNHNYEADPENTKAPTCTEAGVNAEKCTVCGDVKTSAGAPATGTAHNYVADTENTKEPTCGAAGVIAEKCTLCGAVKKTEGAPATNNHNYVADEENTKAPTCGAAGVNAEKCTVCGDVKTSAGEPATGEHNYVVDEAASKAATCGKDGVKVEKCSGCDDVEETKLPATGAHNYVVDEAASKDATCDAEGVKVSKCSVCQDEKSEILPTLKHNYKKDETKSVEATCDVVGKEVYLCGNCGDSYTETIRALTHNFVESEEKSVKATCTTAGKQVKVCEYCKKEESKVLKATGHSWVSAEDETRTAKVCEDAICLNCGAETKASKQHSYVTVFEWKSCVEDGYSQCKCTYCGKSYESFTRALGHAVGEKDWREVGCEPVQGKDCVALYTREAFCGRCGQTVRDQYEADNHVYEYTVLETASCTKEGKMGYACKTCNAPQPEQKTVSYVAEHNWGEGTQDQDGKAKTYTCGTCSATRQEFIETQAPVEKEALSAEVRLGEEGAIISMDETALGGLGNGEIILGADSVSKEQLEQEKIQGLDQLLDGAPVYNITLTVGGELQTTFDGFVTVKIPYVLQEGDDPACITVYYLSQGELDKMEGVYNDGYVTFKTRHFSYYTVGRYSVEDICKIYGHNYVLAEKNATCTEAGYLLETCTRCLGNSQRHQPIIPATGHPANEVVESKQATCIEDGYYKYKCPDCSLEYTVTVPAYGHSWVIDEDASEGATCQKEGKSVTRCENCNETNEISLPQLPHKYVGVVTAPTCTEGGKTVFTCSLCESSYEGAYTEALGHNWSIAEPTCGAGQVCLVCNEAGKPATGEHEMVDGECAVCGFGCEHKYALTEEIKATCYEGGYNVYTCSECGKAEMKDFTKPAGHAYPNNFEACTVCGEENTAIVDSMKSLLASLSSNNYTLKLEDVSIKGILVYENGDEEIQMQIDESDILEIYLSIDENGRILFYLNMHVEGTITEEGETEDFSMEVELYGDGEYVYGLTLDGRNEEQYVRISYEQVFAEMGIAINGDMINANTPAMLLENMLNELLGADMIQAWKAALESNEDLFYSLVGKIFITAFNGEKVDGNVNFTFNVEALKNLNENLSKLTVEELVNEYFGENAFENLQKFVIGLENKTVKDALDAILLIAEEHDIPTSLIYSTIDLVVMTATNEPFDTEAMLNNNAYMNVTFAQLVEELISTGEEGETEIVDDAPAFNYAETIEGLFAEIKGIKVYDMVSEGHGDQVYEMVNQIVAAAEEMVSFTFTVNEKNEFIGLTLSFKEFSLVVGGGGSVGNNNNGNVGQPDYNEKPEVEVMPNQPIQSSSYEESDMVMPVAETKVSRGSYEEVVIISGTLSILPAGGIPAAAEELKAKFETKYAATLAVIKKAVEEADGNVVTLTGPNDTHLVFGKNNAGGIYVELYAIDVKFGGAPVFVWRIEDFEEQEQIDFGSHCLDGVTLTYYGETYANEMWYWAYIECHVDLDEEVLSEVELHLYKEMTEAEVREQVSATVPLTREEAECGDGWYTYYKCLHCGHIQSDYHSKIHEYDYRYTLADGAESCLDGIIEEYYCATCGKVFYTNTRFDHCGDEETITLETPHGELLVEYYECYCGEYTWFEPFAYDYKDGCRLECYEEREMLDGNGDFIGWEYYYECIITDECNFYMVEYCYNSIKLDGECKVERKTEYKFFLDGVQFGETYTTISYEESHNTQDTYTTEYHDDEKQIVKSNTYIEYCIDCGKENFRKYECDELGREIRYEVRNALWSGKGYYYLREQEYESLTSCNYEYRYTFTEGGDWEYVGSSIEHEYMGEEILSATCSQGSVIMNVCTVCQSSQYNFFEPRGDHSFKEIEEGVFECIECGLISNSQKSDIIMEDLTNNDVYGREGYYVIGFFQRYMKEPLQVSLTLRSKTDAELVVRPDVMAEFSRHELFYSPQWHLGDTLILISKSELQAYADRMGYDLAEFELEVSLIPESVAPDQDYDLVNSITLTDLLGLGTEETLPDADVQEPIPDADVQEPIPDVDVQEPIPDVDVQEPIPEFGEAIY